MKSKIEMIIVFNMICLGQLYHYTQDLNYSAIMFPLSKCGGKQLLEKKEVIKLLCFVSIRFIKQKPVAQHFTPPTSVVCFSLRCQTSGTTSFMKNHMIVKAKSFFGGDHFVSLLESLWERTRFEQTSSNSA